MQIRPDVPNLASVEQEFQGPGTQSVDRAAQLLVGVLEGERPQAVTELSERAKLPKSTASRLLSALERHGLVQQHGTRGAFSAGPVLLRYAQGRPGDPNLLALAQQPMHALSEATGETINLAVAGPLGVEHLAQIESRHFLGTGQWVGRRVPYHCTAVGKVLVAFGGADPGSLEPAVIARVRRDGYATAVDELEDGLTAIAAPVPGPTGDVVAAISITGPTLRLPAPRLNELRPLLTKEAKALGARLGHREEDHGPA